jgi:hypothetical protein
MLEVSKVDVKEISTQLGIFCIKVDLNPEQLVLLIAQLEPGNTSTEITLPTVPWSYTILVIH